jgi:two-component system, cell cycle sensor histidine kinase DivJ
VQLHGGELDIRSRLGEGTRVIVRLPVDGEPLHKPAPQRPVSIHALTEPVTADHRVKKIA